MRPSRAHFLSVCGCTPSMRFICLMKHMVGLYYTTILDNYKCQCVLEVTVLGEAPYWMPVSDGSAYGRPLLSNRNISSVFSPVVKLR